MAEEPQKPETALGVSQNVAAALAYVLGWISGVIVLVLEKENKYVRFHAMQSIAVFAPLTIISFAAGYVPVIGGLIGFLVPIATLILLIVLIVTALQGKELKLPYVSEWAENQLR
jgi:uncharacterized membrane protein